MASTHPARRILKLISYGGRDEDAEKPLLDLETRSFRALRGQQRQAYNLTILMASEPFAAFESRKPEEFDAV